MLRAMNKSRSSKKMDANRFNYYFTKRVLDMKKSHAERKRRFLSFIGDHLFIQTAAKEH